MFTDVKRDTGVSIYLNNGFIQYDSKGKPDLVICYNYASTHALY